MVVVVELLPIVGVVVVPVEVVPMPVILVMVLVVREIVVVKEELRRDTPAAILAVGVVVVVL